MANDYQISVGVKADFSDLKSQSAEGAASLENFQSRSARAVQEFQAAAAEGSAAVDFLNKQMQELGAAGIAVVPAMEQATAALRASQAAEEADAIAAKGAAAAKRELAAQTQLASTEMRVFEGSTMGSARAAAMFATEALDLGPIMGAAFPIIGAAAMLEMLFQLGKGVEKFGEDAQQLSNELGVDWLTGALGQLDGLKESTQQADDVVRSLARDMDAMKAQAQELDLQHIRLTQGPKAAYEEQIRQKQTYIGSQQAMIGNIQQAAAPDRQQVSHYEANESYTHAGEVAYLEAKKRLAAYDKQIEDLQGHVDNAQKQIRNFNDEIANIKAPVRASGAGNPAATQMRGDETALADQKHAHAMTVDEETAFWQKRLSAYQHGSAEYLQVENRLNELSAQAQREEAQTRSQFVEQSIQEYQKKQSESERVSEAVNAAHQSDLSRQTSDAQAAAESAQVQIESTAKVGASKIQFEEATGKITKHTAALELGALHAKEYADRIMILTQELKALREVESLGGNTQSQQTGVQNQITGLQGSAQASSYSDMGAAAKKDASAWQQTWNDTFQNVTGSFSQTMATWLIVSDGYNTQFSVLMGRMMVGVVEQFTQQMIQLGVQQAAMEMKSLLFHTTTETAKTGVTATANAARTGISEASVLATIMHDSAKLASHIFTETAHTALVIAGAAERMAIELASVMKSIMMYAASAAVKAWDALAAVPVVGPALGAAAAGAVLAGALHFAGAFEQGGIIPGSVGSAVPILGHAGEAVLPQPLTAMLMQTANGGGTGGGVHYHDHTSLSGIDGASVAGMYRSNAAAGRREFARQMRIMNKV